MIPVRLAQEEEEPVRRVRGLVHQAPRALYIQKEDLERWGYTSNSHRCTHIRHGRKGHGIRHSNECRRRIEEELRNVKDKRLERADERVNEYFAEQMEQQDQSNAERGEDGAEQEANQEEKGGEKVDDPEPMQVEPIHVDDMKEECMMMLKSILRKDRHIELPDKAVVTASGVYEILLLAGLSQEQARDKIVELYSPPRVTQESQARLGMKGITFDLQADAAGKSWDFRKAEDRARVRRMIEKEKPFIVIGSPPCTDWNTRNQNFNHPRMTAEERE